MNSLLKKIGVSLLVCIAFSFGAWDIFSVPKGEGFGAKAGISFDNYSNDDKAFLFIYGLRAYGGGLEIYALGPSFADFNSGSGRDHYKGQSWEGMTDLTIGVRKTFRGMFSLFFDYVIDMDDRRLDPTYSYNFPGMTIGLQYATPIGSSLYFGSQLALTKLSSFEFNGCEFDPGLYASLGFEFNYNVKKSLILFAGANLDFQIDDSYVDFEYRYYYEYYVDGHWVEDEEEWIEGHYESVEHSYEEMGETITYYEDEWVDGHYEPKEPYYVDGYYDGHWNYSGDNQDFGFGDMDITVKAGANFRLNKYLSLDAEYDWTLFSRLHRDTFTRLLLFAKVNF